MTINSYHLKLISRDVIDMEQATASHRLTHRIDSLTQLNRLILLTHCINSLTAHAQYTRTS